MSRYDQADQGWRTPPEVFDPLNAEFGFTLDVAASPENALCSRYYTREQDALSLCWRGERVWCNPPYREILPWVNYAWQEARECGALVVLLLPARTDQEWWARVWRQARETLEGRWRPGEHVRTELRFIRKRVRFLDPATGRPRATAPFEPSVIVIMGERETLCR